MIKFYYMPGDPRDGEILKKLEGAGLEVEKIFCFGNDITYEDVKRIFKKAGKEPDRGMWPAIETDNVALCGNDLYVNDQLLDELIEKLKSSAKQTT